MASRGAQRRVTLRGRGIRLSANAAVSLNMAFHELATDAVRSGPLLGDNGPVDVEWTVDRSGPPGLAGIGWLESGGPAVVDTRRPGLGSRSMQQARARALVATS
jgi:two-component sensor histidine kinase